MTTDVSNVPRHPIGVVARRTGLSIHVLRAWERRHAVVSPARTPGRQRLYTDDDVLRLRLLRRATAAGHAISQVAGLTAAELVALTGGGAAADHGLDDRGAGEEADTGRFVKGCLEAAHRLDGVALDALLMRAVVQLRPADLVERVIGPLLREVGERWHAGRLSPAHEHLVSVAVRRVLGWLLGTFRVGPAEPVLVVTTASGEQHEFGAMLAGVVAAEEGWNVVYLGPSLPAVDIARVAEESLAAGVAISVVHALDRDRIGREVVELRGLLPEGTLLVVGGTGAQALNGVLENAGVSTVHDLAALRPLLQAARLRPRV